MRLTPILFAFACSSCVLVAADHCTDGVLDGTETDVDCGGSCGACVDGSSCLANIDCSSGYCSPSEVCTVAVPTTLPDGSSAHTYSIDNGAGIVITPGAQAGYGITANTGGSYRMVWTGDSNASGTYREFIGTVWTTGHFSSFTPGCSGACPLESNDTVNAPLAVTGGERIDFDTFATDGLDGFDFVVDTEPVFFLVSIDGSNRPDLVFFGSGGATASPATDPFALTNQ